MSERDMQALLALVEKHLGAGWIDAAQWLRNLPSNSVEAIEERLLRGDIVGVVKEVEAAAMQFAAETHNAFATAARRGAKQLDEHPALKDKLIRFDATGSRVQSVARRNQLELVHGFKEERNQIARQITQRAMAENTASNPRQVARMFRDSIGLTPNQEVYVANYRRALEQGDFSRALGYELRDGRADRTMGRLARDGGQLSPRQIDDLAEKYRQNQITWRAENIARTEASKNVHAGLDETFRQAVERGDIKADEIEGEWIPGPKTQDARATHRSSALLDQRPTHGKPFVLPDGTKMAYPGDPAGGPENTAHCRCTVAWTIRLDADDTTPDSGKPPAAPKNPRRQAAARIAAEASVERRREIYSAAKTNLPQELHSTWDKEGHKFMREEAGRIKGVKDRVNASSMLSQAFAEKYGTGAETMFGNEGDRFQRRAEIEAKVGEDWGNEQERKYWASHQSTPTNASDDDPPF